MPKLTSRCDRRDRFGMHAASVAFMAPPRKVSFEDGHSSETFSSPDTSSSSAISVLKEEPAPLVSSKPTLIRPITSLSLVELAQSECDDEENSLSFMSLSHTPVDLRTRTERSEPPLTHPSPWGHFVELLVPSWDVSDNSTNKKTHHDYHQETCSCCSTGRLRRRSSPFGDYSKNKQQRRPLAFLQDDITPFRLSPRKDKSTEKLISGLVRMRVDC